MELKWDVFSFGECIFAPMATINAILITSKKNQPVKIKFRYKDGKTIDLLYTSPVKVFPYDWDKKSQQIKINSQLPKQEIKKINDEVIKIKNAIIEFADTTTGLINNTTLKKHLSKCDKKKSQTATNNKSDKDVNFFGLFETYLNIHTLSAERKESYVVVVNALKRFEFYIQQQNKQFRLDFDTFTEAILFDLERYLAAEYDYIKLNPQFKKKFPKYKSNKPRSQNTINGMLSKIRSFFNWCLKRRYTSTTPFTFFQLKPTIYGTPYFPTKDEIMKIYHHTYTNKTLNLQAKIFVFQCMVGARVGDFYRLKHSNIVDGNLVYIPEKQKHKWANTLTIPLNNIAKEIIKNYSSKDGDKLFDFCSLVHYNKFIKDAFTLAQIKRPVAVLDHLTGEEVIRNINEIISSHAARRFFIGTIYNEVQDPNLIGELSGHVYGSRAFSRYRNVNSEVKEKLVSYLDNQI